MKLPKITVRRLVAATALLIGLGVAVAGGSELWINGVSAGHRYAESDVPAAPVALVLGAEVYPDGTPSPFVSARLEIARQLYVDGKVRAILVSGDHSRWTYDEPDTMASWLRNHGVPAARIAQDYAGFDTYDSCSRAHRIFGVNRAIVVTQTYHLDRAIALCRSLGVQVDGVGDDSVRIYRGPWRNSVVRERGAVVKAAWDVLSHRDPVFLGRRETSVDDALR